MTRLPPLLEPWPLEDAARGTFHREGHLQQGALFSAEEVAAYRPVLREYILHKHARLQPGERAMGASAQDTVFSLGDAPEAVAAFVTSPRLGALAARLLGVPAVRLLHFTGFFKPAGGPPTPWHQDLAFIPLDSDQVLSVWIPLTDVTSEMGGLVFASGSHQQGLQNPAAVGRFPIVRKGPMRAGDASLHLGWTLHAALRNTSRSMREAIAVCFYADGARIAEHHRMRFSQSLMASYFAGLRPGEPAVGPMNPIVFRRSDAVT